MSMVQIRHYSIKPTNPWNEWMLIEMHKLLIMLTWGFCSQNVGALTAMPRKFSIIIWISSLLVNGVQGILRLNLEMLMNKMIVHLFLYSV